MDLESYLNRKKMDVKDLASMLGVKPAAIYNYKYGKSKPSYEVIEKLLLDGATIAEVFSPEVEAAVSANIGQDSSKTLDPEEIVRLGLLALAKRSQD